MLRMTTIMQAGDATNVIIGIEFDKIQFDDFLVSLSPPILLTAASVLVFMLTIFRKVVRSSFDVQTITHVPSLNPHFLPCCSA